MHIHAINLPQFVIVGPNVLPKIKEVLSRLIVREDVLLLRGEGFTKTPASAVRDFVAEMGLTAHEVAVKSPTEEVVSFVEGVIKETRSCTIISVGGGKIIDVAKIASHRQGIPFISIPTSAAHDGIASPIASIKGENGSASIMAHPPVALLADTNIIASSPKRFIISGCGDIIAKLTAVRDWRLAHRLRGEYYGEYAASLALMSAQLIRRNVDLIARGLEAGVRTVIEGLISCGYAMCIAGSSRPCSGSEHLFSHALDKLGKGSRALHGEKCGVGTIMMMYMHGGDWESVRAVLSRAGAPTTAKGLGLSDDDVLDALTIAHTIRPERYTILGESGISRNAAEDLARMTGVID
ncbi:MAG: NAD(P)-dependent glycerol-1-phosphate dehydrogenase [Candidatus Verstraetearchaeota archaeon]|nr:NAD(P)-dependent glycerol-1-phosphate dehydrogenase [Candidatus Verstraetearchaeota archaeon]